MAADEAARFSAIETDAPESAPANEAPESAPDDDTRANDDVVADAWTWSKKKKKLFIFYGRHGVPSWPKNRGVTDGADEIN